MSELDVIVARGTTIVVRVATPTLTVTDHVIPAGFPGPPLHVHPIFDEVFVVLEGTLAMRVRDEVREIGAGETAFAPGHVPHTFANQSEDDARFLAVMSPGGFEAYFRAMADGDEELVAAVSERFGYVPVPAASGSGAPLASR